MSDQASVNTHHLRGKKAEALVARHFKAAEEVRPRIQEVEFRTTFLPMFVGGGDYVVIDAWRAVAGSLLNEVDVFSGNELLFTVPPVHLDVVSVVSSRSPTGTSINTLNGALLSVADDPGGIEAMALVDTQVDQAEEMVVDRRDEYMERWDQIFQRYGIDYKEVRRQVAAIKSGVPAQEVISNKIETSSKKLADEELEFDDNNFESY